MSIAERGHMHSSSNRVGGSGYGVPPADTGNPVLNWISDTLTSFVRAERRIDPFVRPAFDALFRDRLSELITNLINARRKDEGYKLAEERTQPNEEENLQDIINSFNAQMRRLWNPGYFERGGNTKTHGVLRAEFIVRDDLPEHMRRGIFGRAAPNKARVRDSRAVPFVSTG